VDRRHHALLHGDRLHPSGDLETPERFPMISRKSTKTKQETPGEQAGRAIVAVAKDLESFVKQTIEDEREACARLAEGSEGNGQWIAREIRARPSP
jgi:hypothetical protein